MLGLCPTRQRYKTGQCTDPKRRAAGRAVPALQHHLFMTRNMCSQGQTSARAGMSWDILIVSHAAACATAGKMATQADLSIHPSQNLLFLEGSQWLQHKRKENAYRLRTGAQARSGTGAAGAVEDFQQVLALGLVQALGLQL